jgi:hypothetical protein
VSNSDRKVLPNVLVAAPAYLKYSRIENLFFSRESVKASEVVLTVLSSAVNAPVALILFTRFFCRFAWAVAAAELDLATDV